MGGVLNSSLLSCGGWKPREIQLDEEIGVKYGHIQWFIIFLTSTWMSNVLWSRSVYISIWSWLQYLATSIRSAKNLIQMSWGSINNLLGYYLSLEGMKTLFNSVVLYWSVINSIAVFCEKKYSLCFVPGYVSKIVQNKLRGGGGMTELCEGKEHWNMMWWMANLCKGGEGLVSSLQ